MTHDPNDKNCPVNQDDEPYPFDCPLSLCTCKSAELAGMESASIEQNMKLHNKLEAAKLRNERLLKEQDK